MGQEVLCLKLEPDYYLHMTAVDGEEETRMRIATLDWSFPSQKDAGRSGSVSRLGLGMLGRESCPSVSRTRGVNLEVQQAAKQEHPMNVKSWREILHILAVETRQRDGCCERGTLAAVVVVGSKTVDKHSVEDTAGHTAMAATADMLPGHRVGQDTAVAAGNGSSGQRRRTAAVGMAATTTRAAHSDTGGASRLVDRISTRTLHFAGLVAGPWGGPSSSPTSSTSCTTMSTDVVPCRRKPLFRVTNSYLP